MQRLSRSLGRLKRHRPLSKYRRPNGCPVPDATAREKGLAAVREVFKADIEKAKSPAEQVALAEKLLKTAAETKDDPVGRFAALWQLALEMATKVGDPAAAFAAHSTRSRRTTKSTNWPRRSRTFAVLAPRITTKTFAETHLMASIDRPAPSGADRYEIATKSVSRPTNTLAQRLADAATKKDIAAQHSEVEQLEKVYASVLAARKTLETAATDVTANLIVGKYENGQGELGNGTVVFRAVRRTDLQGHCRQGTGGMPNDVAERVAVADEWWKLGESDKTPLKDRLKVHAAELYAAALPDATGLTKKKIETRLADAAKIPKSALVIKMPGEANSATITNKIGMKFNLIPAGEFLMGSADSELGHDRTETQHRVKITKPFYLGVYDVTRGESPNSSPKPSTKPKGKEMAKDHTALMRAGFVHRSRNIHGRLRAFTATNKPTIIRWSASAGTMLRPFVIG